MTSEPEPQRWVEATVYIAAHDAELVASALHESGADGVVVEPAIRISDDANFAYDELEDEEWVVKGYFPAPVEPNERRAIRRRIVSQPLDSPLGRIGYREVEPQNWAETWREFYHVLHIGERLVVRPSWEPYEAQPHEVVMDLDPGAAFGTGQHETTRLCLLAVERHVRPGMDVLDVGAGSGILAVAALKLGAREALAIDNDATTVPVAEGNAALNNVADRMLIAAGSMGDGWPWADRDPHECADLVLANISSTYVVDLMPELVAAARPGGLLIASGFIARDADEVRTAATSAGLTEVSLEAEGDWRCLVARRD
jgi:ribosomal protein L11 methyltransferase